MCSKCKYRYRKVALLAVLMAETMVVLMVEMKAALRADQREWKVSKMVVLMAALRVDLVD
jgi:ABC-type uncharacterized transport system YnjBCD ATPase subunit